MNCVQCGCEIQAGFAFCPSCGAKQPKSCPGCGYPCQPDFAFCPQCGTAIAAAPATQKPQQPRSQPPPVTIAVAETSSEARSEQSADADLYIYDEVIEPYVDKQIRPSRIIANPGEIVTVTLQGGTTERPDPPRCTDRTRR